MFPILTSQPPCPAGRLTLPKPSAHNLGLAFAPLSLAQCSKFCKTLPFFSNLVSVVNILVLLCSIVQQAFTEHFFVSHWWCKKGATPVLMGELGRQLLYSKEGPVVGACKESARVVGALYWSQQERVWHLQSRMAGEGFVCKEETAVTQG